MKSIILFHTQIETTEVSFLEAVQDSLPHLNCFRMQLSHYINGNIFLLNNLPGIPVVRSSSSALDQGLICGGAVRAFSGICQYTKHFFFKSCCFSSTRLLSLQKAAIFDKLIICLRPKLQWNGKELINS